MSSSRTRSATFTASQSAPSSSSIRDASERRSSSKGKRARELTCETCGKHPVCLQKHRWEHTPQWRDTAQLLLSKHQQVQLMEAAAILVYGSSLPQDRSLWPIYMSGGAVQLPKPGNDAPSGRARSMSLSTSVREGPRSSQFDDEELEEVSEAEEVPEEEDEEDVEGMEEDETDESDVPVAATDYGRARSHSVGLASPVQSHLHGSTAVGSRMLPTSLAPTSYGWGVITESGQYGSYQGSVGTKSPLSDSSVRSEIDDLRRDAEDEEAYDYHHSRASSLYKRLSSTMSPGHHHHRSVSSTGSYQVAADSAASKTHSPDRRRDEDIYEMEMD
ncbi:hypothetical protein FRC17_008989 [Serendipita sp. 399]|nr:hypothetical protein FRC17_008989 [Serendipita sp. 399]